MKVVIVNPGVPADFHMLADADAAFRGEHRKRAAAVVAEGDLAVAHAVENCGIRASHQIGAGAGVDRDVLAETDRAAACDADDYAAIHAKVPPVRTAQEAQEQLGLKRPEEGGEVSDSDVKQHKQMRGEIVLPDELPPTGLAHRAV